LELFRELATATGVAQRLLPAALSGSLNKVPGFCRGLLTPVTYTIKRIAHVERVLDLLEPTGLADVVANVKPAVIDSFRHPVPW
jgi:hypothetical protein